MSEKIPAAEGRIDRELTLDPGVDLSAQSTVHLAGADTTQSCQRLELIYTLGRSVFAETDVHRILAFTVPAIARLIPLERCFVATVNRSGELRAKAMLNIKLGINPEAWPVSHTILDRVIRDGISLLVGNAMSEEGLSDRKSVGMHGIRSVLAVPLGTRDSPLGLIYADSTVERGAFSGADLVFLTALAQYVTIALRNAGEWARVEADCRLTKERLAAVREDSFPEPRIVGRSKAFLSAHERLERAAVKDVSILLLGETGTGKEIFARAAHRMSARKNETFLPVNIAALSETLVESELFGHEKGAFSSASGRRIGRFELAHGGTLFLDEIADIPMGVQSKLLRTIETGEFQRVGGAETLRADVRLVSATNRNLEEEVRQGRFRSDLYYRIQGVSLTIPPLRERRDDIPELLEHVRGLIGSEKRFDPAAVERLQGYAWPGNVRQLMRLVEEMDAVNDGPLIRVEDLPAYVRESGAKREGRGFPTLKDAVEDLEREHFRRALALAEGNNERAMELLGVSRGKYFERKKIYGL